MFTGLLIGLTCLWLKGAFDKQLHQDENETAYKYRREFPEEYRRRWLHRKLYGYPDGAVEKDGDAGTSPAGRRTSPAKQVYNE